ncbi:Hypothetical predicted protein [Pelobates cultripes]|uniref:Uncharacterized protein n=1 Tax=Pelobates cultripes TaxID=61616 RepID=A0AAD1TE53_PELCU|nr:Hypothetical predicted protein [Pelobates cultripes]
MAAEQAPPSECIQTYITKSGHSCWTSPQMPDYTSSFMLSALADIEVPVEGCDTRSKISGDLATTSTAPVCTVGPEVFLHTDGLQVWTPAAEPGLAEPTLCFASKWNWLTYELDSHWLVLIPPNGFPTA